MMVSLKRGAKRPAVTLFQRAYNDRAKARGWPQLTADGENGPATLAAAIRACRALGAMQATLTIAKKTGLITVGMQRMVRWPEKRSVAQLRRAKARAAAQTSGPHAAIAWARQYIGKTEDPPGSNRGDWGLTQWQRDLGDWLVGQAWCGVGVGTALIRAGVKGINSRVAGVILILDDALNSRNGWDRCVYRRRTGHGSVSAGKPGDAVGLFGESTHVELIEKRVPGGYATIGFNTSSGNAGSQSSGGGVWRRIRPDGAVVYVARPRYPEA